MSTPDEQEPQKITIPPGEEGPEIPLEAQLAALRASMSIMAQQHGKVVADLSLELEHATKEYRDYRRLFYEARDRVEQLKKAKIKPLVILELEDNEDASTVAGALDLHIETAGEVFASARFVAILRPGATDDD